MRDPNGGRFWTSGRAWAEHYWGTWQRPYRQQLANVLGSLLPGPEARVLEIGCNTGPNLRLWRSRWPQLYLFGFDAHAEAVAYGQRNFEDDARVDIWQEDVLATAAWPSVDVVVSCYSLVYVPAEHLADVLARIAATARIGFVIAEPMEASALLPVEGLADYIWAHPYAHLLEDTIPGDWTVHCEAVEDPVDALNGIVAVTKGLGR